MPLPRDILERAERVLEYHRTSKLDEQTKVLAPDLRARPDVTRVFDFAPKVPLSPNLMDVSVGVLAVMEQGLDAIADSLHAPPQDLRTLSTWLHFAAGHRKRIAMPWGQALLRAMPSAGHTCPTEIYVAAFAIDGLTPGLYHYSDSEFALRKLRDGPETLSLMRRGRPDLQFLGTSPCALLVSTVFSRSSWLQGKRGYRQSLIDAGHLVANLHITAMGLGMSTIARLRLTESSMRELIGLPVDVDYASAESVQAMVVWADGAIKPMPATPPLSPGELYTIPRASPRHQVMSYGSILAVHHDVSAPGIAIREIRPPLTDLTPVPARVHMDRLATATEELGSAPLRSVLLDPRYVEQFQARPLSRLTLVRIARSSFRGGTYFPLKPDGPHAALVRPFWVIQNVIGQDPGIWWYDPVLDRWSQLNHGQYNRDTGPITRRNIPYDELFINANAVCVMVANLRHLLAEAGPDLYRLAHLEAGVVAQRINLGANAVGFATRTFGEFMDDRWKQFLGLGQTGWEPLAVCAIGGVQGVDPKQLAKSDASSLEFRD